MPQSYSFVASHANAKKPTSKMKASKYPPKKNGNVKKVKKY